MSDRLKKLEHNKGYAAFAHLFLPGLQLYYSRGLSLRETADLLGMSNWAQARRILNPGEAIATVRTLMHTETIWLESEQIEQARATINRCASEPAQWQIYLNTLL